MPKPHSMYEFQVEVYSLHMGSAGLQDAVLLAKGLRSETLPEHAAAFSKPPSTGAPERGHERLHEAEAEQPLRAENEIACAIPVATSPGVEDECFCSDEYRHLRLGTREPATMTPWQVLAEPLEPLACDTRGRRTGGEGGGIRDTHMEQGAGGDASLCHVSDAHAACSGGRAGARRQVQGCSPSEQGITVVVGVYMRPGLLDEVLMAIISSTARYHTWRRVRARMQ